MVFCNPKKLNYYILLKIGHNPYFNRWFSAILVNDKNKIDEDCHNPYFNRWFSAIWQTR